MTFIVTYREKDGALAEVEIEAAGRAECFTQCRARGIAPMKVREGGGAQRAQGSQGAKNQETKTPRTPREPGHPGHPRHPGNQGAKARSNLLGVLGVLGVLAILALAIAWFWHGGRGAPAEPVKPPATDRPKAADRPEARPSRPRDAKLPPTTTAKPAAAPATATNAAAAVKTQAEKPAEVVISAQTNKSGYVIERVRNPDGTIGKRIHSPPPLFKHQSDQMIAIMLSASPGQAIPPMPDNAFTDEEFMRSLEEPIKILDTDRPEVKDMKAKVIVAREDIRAMMKKGYSALQVLQEHRDLFNDNAKLHSDALMELNSILESGDREGARKYAVAMNAAFQQMGVPELKVPSKDGVAEEEARTERLNLIKERAKQRKEIVK